MFFVGLITQPKILNPITVFFGLWTIILFMSDLKLYNILVADDDTYKMILVGSIMFALGFFVWKWFLTKSKFALARSSVVKEYRLNYNAIYLMAIFCILFYFWDLSKVIGFLLDGKTLGFIRENAQEGQLYSESGILNAIRMLIVSPFSSVLMIVTPVDFFRGRKDKKLMFFTLAVLVLKMLTDASRSRMIYLIMSAIICYFYARVSDGDIKRRYSNFMQKINISKTVPIFILGCLCAGGLLYFITLSRSGSNALRHTYYYFAMEPIMLQKWCKLVDKADMIGYGCASANGVLFPFFYVIKNLFGLEYPALWQSAYDMIVRVGTDWQVIAGVGTTANSYATVFLTLYMDGRFFGVVLGMFLYGAVVAKSYVSVLRNPNQKNLSIYCLILIGVFYTFIQLMFNSFYYCITLIMIAFFAYHRVREY